MRSRASARGAQTAPKQISNMVAALCANSGDSLQHNAQLSSRARAANVKQMKLPTTRRLLTPCDYSISNLAVQICVYGAWLLGAPQGRYR